MQNTRNNVSKYENIFLLNILTSKSASIILFQNLYLMKIFAEIEKVQIY